MYVRAKKSLGQHFLKDQKIAQRIVESLDHSLTKNVLEVGPGTGVLTNFLVLNNDINFKAIEIDNESIEYLRNLLPQFNDNLIAGDFLRMNLDDIFSDQCSIIGNFPYNISSQIFFKVLDSRDKVVHIVCMLQKEVAERLASPPGNKSYGILSVLLQTWYDIDYLFGVSPSSFIPPPKVNSAVISLRRNGRSELNCDEKSFKQIVKATFNQRRKQIKNTVKQFVSDRGLPDSELLVKRPEQLTVEDFIELTNLIFQR